jgi:hypothetical protein
VSGRRSPVRQVCTDGHPPVRPPVTEAPDQVHVVGRLSEYLRISDEADRRERVFSLLPGSWIAGLHRTRRAEPDRRLGWLGRSALLRPQGPAVVRRRRWRTAHPLRAGFLEVVWADGFGALRRRSGRPHPSLRQESARSSAARSKGPPCVASTCSTGKARSGRRPLAISSRVAPGRSHRSLISRP